MPYIFAALYWLAAVIGQAALATIGMLTSKYAMRAATLMVAAALFWVAFELIYTGVEESLNMVVAEIQLSQASLGVNAEFMLCLVPASLPEALSVLIGIMLAAVTVKWTREILFLKLA